MDDETNRAAKLAALQFVIAGIITDQRDVQNLSHMYGTSETLALRNRTRVLEARIVAGTCQVDLILAELGIPEDQRIRPGIHLTDYGIRLAEWSRREKTNA